MRRYLISFLCFAVVLAKEDITKEKYDEHYGKDGESHNAEFDHQAILGSQKLNKEFHELEPTEAKRRLDLLVKRMDLNQDKYVDKDELTKWIVKSFLKLDEEESQTKFEEQDTNGDGMLTWDEYLMSVYNFKKEDAEDWSEDKNPMMKQYGDMVNEDRIRFDMADTSKDGVLKLAEYYAFSHPWNYQHTQSLEIQNAFKEHDLNNDGFIDLKEYLGDADRDKKVEIVDTENFNEYDADGDGKLNRAEVHTWMIPDYERSAKEEAKHLIKDTDLDGDGRLLRQEILNKYDLWVGSSAMPDASRRDEL